MFRDLVCVFDKIMSKHNLTYFLYGGTLIGYYRNGTVMPWDDDFDVAMDVASYKVVVDEVSKLVSDRVLTEQRLRCSLIVISTL